MRLSPVARLSAVATAAALLLAVSIPLSASAASAGDDFNRADAASLGADWTARQGIIGVAGNSASSQTTQTSVSTLSGATGDLVSVDALAGGSGVRYVAAVSRYTSNNDNLFVKIQANGGAKFDYLYVYTGNNGGNFGTWTTPLPTAVDAARLTTSVTGNVLTIGIDSDFNGTADQSFTVDQPWIGARAGTGAGLGMYGNVRADNFVAGVKTATTTTVATTESPAAAGAPASFTATVAAGSTPVSSGTVTFSIDGVASAPVAVNASGVATTQITSATRGARSVTAVYSGSSLYETSTSATFSHVITAPLTTTSVVSSLQPSSFGESVTFTASVDSADLDVDSGSVVFTVDGTPSSPVAVVDGVASFTTSTLAVGSRSVVAAYSGGTQFGDSTSTTLSQTVSTAASATSIESSLNPSVFGDAVQVTVEVAAGSTVATGDVVFTVDDVERAPIALVDGVAELELGTVDAGAHSISAAYSGDDSHAESTSSVLTQTVAQAASAVVVTSSPAPSSAGEEVVFTATVSSDAGVVDDGSVSFLVDGVLSEPVLVVDGAATLALSTLEVGSHTIEAGYADGTNFAGSDSASLDHEVSRATTTVDLESSNSDAVAGESTTLTATVTSAVEATGTVDFAVDGEPLGSAPVTDGVATLAVSGLRAGTYGYTAAYSGDDSSTSADADELVQVVGKRSPVVTVTAPTDTVVGDAIEIEVAVTPGETETAPVDKTVRALAASLAAAVPPVEGTVLVTENGETLGTADLVDGAASLSIEGLAAGGHSLLVAYSGGPDDLAASTGITVVVEAAPVAESTPGELASTGSDIMPLLAGGLAALLAGLGLAVVAASRRRA